MLRVDENELLAAVLRYQETNQESDAESPLSVTASSVCIRPAVEAGIRPFENTLDQSR
jgi:hypothetical protein